LSIEIRAGWPCPHLVIEEPVTLASDRRSVTTRAPVSGAASVRILLNDEVYVPAGGLYSQASLTSSSAGPYRIERCVGTLGPDANVFTVTTGTGTASVRLPEGSRIPLSQIQRALRLSPINDLVIVSDQNCCLQLIEANDAGPTSFIRVSGRGARALGFLQVGARGQQVYPPWELLSRSDINPITIPTGVRIVPARYPIFREEVRGNPTIKVTYASMPERCPRCGATYVENDYRFDTLGAIITIENEDLLYQACLKAILTVQGSNPFHPTYGSKVLTRIGRKIVGASAALVKEDVINALTQVKNLQGGQRRYQRVKDRELLFSVETVDVRPSEDDPTVYFVDVVVRSGSNQPVSLTTVFTVPGAIALAGSNNTALGLEAAGLTTAQSRRLLLDG
jgi:hypothetical protein